MKMGHKLVTNGTVNHLLLLNVRDLGLTGSKFEKMCDEIHITLNKNTILGDQSAITPGGVRIGTPAVTTRGYVEDDMKQVARFLDETAKLSIDIHVHLSTVRTIHGDKSLAVCLKAGNQGTGILSNFNLDFKVLV